MASASSRMVHVRIAGILAGNIDDRRLRGEVDVCDILPLRQIHQQPDILLREGHTAANGSGISANAVQGGGYAGVGQQLGVIKGCAAGIAEDVRDFEIVESRAGCRAPCGSLCPRRRHSGFSPYAGW